MGAFAWLTQHKGARTAMSKPRKKPGNGRLSHKSERAVWIADASTLEAIKKHLGQLQEKTGKLLAGKILMVVEAFTPKSSCSLV